MRSQLRLLLALIVAAPVLGQAGSAWANAVATAGYGSGGLGTGVVVSGSESGGTYQLTSAGPPDPGYYGATVISDTYGGASWMGEGQTTAQQAGCAGGLGTAQSGAGAPVGSVLYVLVNSQGDPMGTAAVACTPGPGGTGVIAPPPPPPPSGSQVWAAASNWEPLVSAGIEANPDTQGLTGLSSWFWLSNPTTALPPLTAAVNGYAVTASASISSYTWTFGDGNSASAYSPGSASDPAATYTYETKGGYTVSVIAHYVGSYTITGFGLAPQTFPLDIDVTMGTLSYGVQEIRSVLIYPGSAQ